MPLLAPAPRSRCRNTCGRLLPYPKVIWFGLAFVCLLALGSPATFAQDTSDDDVIRVSTDLLLFPVRIRDKRGQAVTGLTEQDLSLKDDDRVTTGLYFSPGADRVALAR